MRKKIILGLVAAALFLLVAVNFFLTVRLTGYLNSSVLPDVGKKWGVPISVQRMTAGFPFGGVRLAGLAVGNPPGFAEPAMLTLDKGAVDIGFFPLLSGVLSVSDVRMDTLQVAVIRHKDGRLNIDGLIAPQPESPPAGTTNRQDRVRKQDYRVRKASVSSSFEYVDHLVSAKPFRIGMDLDLKASDVATIGNPDDRGRVVITGHLKGKPEAMVTRLEIKPAPLADSAKPTFELEGKLSGINTRDIQELADYLGVHSDSIEIEVRLKCREGAFQKSASDLKVSLREVKLSGKTAAKAKNFPIPNELTLTIPVGGTIQSPELDTFAALVEALATHGAALLKMDDKKMEKKLNKFLQKLQGKSSSTNP